MHFFGQEGGRVWVCGDGRRHVGSFLLRVGAHAPAYWSLPPWPHPAPIISSSISFSWPRGDIGTSYVCATIDDHDAQVIINWDSYLWGQFLSQGRDVSVILSVDIMDEKYIFDVNLYK